jgi:fimbrial chaperone protein
MIFLYTLIRLSLVAGLGLLASASGQAATPTGNGGISLSQTRVIFTAEDNAQTLTVKNTSNRTFLIQSRVVDARDRGLSAPFIVTPPLFKLAPGNRQTLRVMSQNTSLPTDRESLFHLSVLAIPASENQEETPMQLSMGIRFGLKLFYRPAGQDAPTESHACSLRFTQSAQEIRIHNPTPHFQTLGTLTLGNTAMDLKSNQDMLPPGGELTLPISTQVTKVQWQVINDYGALSPYCQSALSRTTEKL